jgi:hypothetical protein
MYKEPATSFRVEDAVVASCAAYRHNGGYIKQMEPAYEGNTQRGWIYNNKSIIIATLNPYNNPDEFTPAPIELLPEDVEFATEIKNYFRRLIFAAIIGTNEFQTKLFKILEGDTVKANDMAFIACLPTSYNRAKAESRIKKLAAEFDPKNLGTVGSTIFDRDCDILDVSKATTYDGWNVTAIIDNSFLATWSSKHKFVVGNCVVVRANIKDYSTHWLFKVPSARLNYVKAVQ